MAQNIDLDTTLAALQHDLKSLPSEEALAILNAWHDQFKGTDLDDDLKQVKEAITKDGRTGVSLGHALINLGATTAAIAADTDDETAVKLQQIAALLSEAGNAIEPPSEASV